MKKLLAAMLGAGLLATTFSAPAQANPNQCGQDWQFVGYGILAYTHAPSTAGKEQLLGELMSALRQATRDCSEEGNE